jgi:hypothetical protein
MFTESKNNINLQLSNCRLQELTQSVSTKTIVFTEY